LIKDYTNSFYLIPKPNILYFSTTGEIYWGRMILQEIIQTFLFTLVYLVLKYDASMNKIDRVTKGIVISFVFLVCLVMTRGSGGCLNPAIGLAQSTYMLGML
jgi:glycerol uptake facilitator-like aquaporin